MKSISAEQKKEWADILYNQALLTEGSPLKDPMKFAKQVANLMTSH
jgi:molecular chaperone HtpG